MEKDLQQIQQEFEQQLQNCTAAETLRDIEVEFFGRKGKLPGVMKQVKDLPQAERKAAGQKGNELKKKLERLFAQKQQELHGAGGTSEMPIGFDATAPGVRPQVGSLHPHTQLMHDLNRAFLSLGFELYTDDPEISDEEYAFDNLNFPPEHPARASMDTYWVAGTEDERGSKRLCLRPHLTGGSVRFMQERKPPFRFVYPGRVFRSEATDASHERTFYQYEALLVDKEVPFSAGRVLVDTILERVFGQKVKTRMRSGFFPFVEPGFEIDMQCLVCDGTGCSVCGHIGWVEMMPGGPPHPNVFRAAGVDPNKWQGFYINIGLDRLVMMKYGIDDVRLFHSGDLRFLQQF